MTPQGELTIDLRGVSEADVARLVREALAQDGELREVRLLRSSPRPVSGELLAVYGPKGGIGRTTISVNTAIALHARTNTPVALVDLDLQFGDVGVLCDLRSQGSALDLPGVDPHDAAADGRERIFVRHASGIDVLLAPQDPHAARSADVPAVVHAVGALRGHYRYIVADLWPALDDLTLGILNDADRVVLVTTPELPALRSLRRAIAAGSAAMRQERTVLVVNRLPSRTALAMPDIERAIGRAPDLTIPSDDAAATDAADRGIPLMDRRVRGHLAEAYVRLAAILAAPAREPAAAPALAMER